MEPRESSGTFEETAQYQRRYESLLEVCDSQGTMVLQDRLLEKDKDILPYRFFRRGTREYVFPKQEVVLDNDGSRIIDPTPGYSLRLEKQAFTFDEGLVEGRVRIEYEDAGNRPLLKVVDVLGESRLPEEVVKTLDDLF